MAKKGGLEFWILCLILICNLAVQLKNGKITYKPSLSEGKGIAFDLLWVGSIILWYIRNINK